MKWTGIRMLAGFAAAVCAGMSGAAEAQSAAAADAQARGGLEEVVVTAQRREENLQTVPVAVTAFTPAQLAGRQIDNIGALSAVAPNMTFGVAYDPTDIVIGVRGLSETVPQLGVDPAVGVYVDGVYYSLTAGSNRAFIDMDRVEVLRGPQGTLFGRNTIGGALNITTHAPENSYSASAEAEVGNFNEYRVTGIVNAPISASGAAVRFVYQHDEHKGYGQDTLLNTPLSDAKEDYFRGSGRLPLAEHWNLLATGDYYHFTGHPVIQKVGYLDTNPAVPPQAIGATGAFLNAVLPAVNGHPGDLLSNYVGGNFYNTQGSIDPLTSIQDFSFTVTLDGRIAEGVNFKSITGYNDFRRSEGTDSDGTPYDLLDIVSAPTTAEQRSEEMQLYGDAADKRLHWITGIYFFGLHGRQGDISNLFQGLPFGFQNYLDQSSDNDSKGAFAQATYEVVPRLRVTGGLRYTRDTRRATNFDHVNTFAGQFIACGMSMTAPAPTLATCALSGEAAFSYVPWTVGVDFTPFDNLLLYAKGSKGFRSGGFSQIAPAPPAPPVSTLPYFSPEDVMSYEVGEKLELLDHHLRINAALFDAEYNSIQQSFNIATQNGPITVTQNVGKARFQGGELEVTALIADLTLNASLGVIDPKFTEGPNVGLPVTNVSKTTCALSGNYPVHLSFGTLTLNADYNWRSREYFFEPIPGNIEQANNIAQGDFGLFDASLVLALKSTPLSVSIWGRNLNDEQYKARATGLIAGGLPFDPYIAGTPRTYGASVKFQF